MALHNVSADVADMSRRSLRLLRPQRNGHGPLPLCAPGTHAFAEIVGTVAGKAEVTRVVCNGCRRTFQQVMAESPDDLALYRSWLETEIRTARAMHDRACPRRHDLKALPSDRCPGCIQEAALAATDKEAGHP